MPANTPDLDHLTPRELQILQLLGNFPSNCELGKALGMGEKTVEFHLGNLRKKLGVNTRTKLILFSQSCFPPVT